MNDKDFYINAHCQLITNSLIEALSSKYEVLREEGLKSELERKIMGAEGLYETKKGLLEILVDRNLLLKNKEHYFLEGKLSELLQKCGVKEDKFISMRTDDKKKNTSTNEILVDIVIIPLVSEKVYELPIEKLIWLAESWEEGVSDAVFVRWAFEPEINVREYIFGLVKKQLKCIGNRKETMEKKQRMEDAIKKDLLNIIDETLLKHFG
ncbi:hypothetical protein [Bacillus toyonensis]|uniref:hypothetical protein n=1 Tax=Bacillus toyonensis TaxID=155322 RepID=UPI002E1A7525|nr:hypothetical protein [Bacillus toyonensis]